MPRRHEDDLAGRILAREGEARQGWHVVDLLAIAEDDGVNFPVTCTVEEDWREVGEALCEERYPLETLEQIQNTIVPRSWASLYQQRPRPREGSSFEGSWFPSSRMVDDAPADCRFTRYWDTAGIQGRGDYTCGVLMARSPAGRFYVCDVVRGEWSPGKRDERIRHTAEQDKAKCGTVRIWLEKEAGVAGTERSDATVRLLAGHTVRTERPTGSKEHRADPLAAQCEIGNVLLVKGAWVTPFLDELCAFPHGRNDDQVDAASGAFAKLTRAEPARLVSFPWL